MRVSSLIQSVFRRARLNIHAYPSARHLALDYPVAQAPRYGGKLPTHRAIAALLDKRRALFDATLDELATHEALFRHIPCDGDWNGTSPYWDNMFFPPLDACVLMHYLIRNNPRRLVEIGSGNSTIFARYAIDGAQLRTKITSIDPQPRRGVDSLCDEVVRSRLEDLTPGSFPKLQKGDILFFDGSHRVFNDSDVTVFFLEILPSVPAGVLVHIHDIFWPRDYPEEWGERYYSEQYMLAMLLLYAAEDYPVLFSSVYASLDPELRAKAAASTPGKPIFGVYGTSFWVEKAVNGNVS